MYCTLRYLGDGQHCSILKESAAAYSLMVEMRNLLPENEVLEKRGAPRSALQAVLIWNRTPNVACQIYVCVVDRELIHKLPRSYGLLLAARHLPPLMIC